METFYRFNYFFLFFEARLNYLYTNKVAGSFYFFQSNYPCNHKSLQLHIIPSIETVMQNHLLMFVSMEEVKSVIFAMYSYDAWFSAHLFQNLFTHC